MGVDQTSQLIQLLLNSILMIVACIILITGLSMRHSLISQELYSWHRAYLELSKSEDGQSLTEWFPWVPTTLGERSMGAVLTRLKTHAHQLRQRRKAMHTTLLLLYYALATFVASTFTLALRTMVEWNGLIQVAIGFFVVGLVMLWGGVGLVLWDIHRSRSSLWDEFTWSANSLEKKPRGKSTILVKRKPVPPSSPKAAVGVER
ncbi:MAG: DUF2721 domain-containing protein [Leptolyngbyaceae cyanobacterium SL_7_1]|nr:DUF2721 domain-containing protein [Leptolyngbyaceae cyanobacterium SL_7_1]